MVGMQRVFTVKNLPTDGIGASAAFVTHHLGNARAVLAGQGVDAIAIVLPPAGPEQRDWRTAMARDLARAHAPQRVNIASGNPGAELDALLAYLGNAPGVTGHYCEVHDQAN
jgi:hypothetical protein